MEEEFYYDEDSKQWKFTDDSMNAEYTIELVPQRDNQGLIWAHWPKKVKKSNL